jgi:hypothetical protein
MTAVDLLERLTARGIEFQAQDNKLRFRPWDGITAEELQAIRCLKHQLLVLVKDRQRADSIWKASHRSPNQAPSCRDICDRCGAAEYKDTLIHEGRSTRRECARCNRFFGWPCWYGQLFDSSN